MVTDLFLDYGKRWEKFFGQKNRIGTCPALDLLFPYMTVHETLTYFAKIRNLTENEVLAQVPEILKITNLDEHEYYLVKALSTSITKKLQLAIALLGYPSLVFLDEITSGNSYLYFPNKFNWNQNCCSGLSRQDKKEIWRIIKNFNNERRTTFILSTKSFEEAEEISDRIALLYRGIHPFLSL